MERRYNPIIPEYIQQTFEKIHDDHGSNDEEYEKFAGRWGGLTIDSMQRALAHAEGDDCLCAIFALSASTLPEATDLLHPFLQSSRRDERCISAIALGMRNDEQAYPSLEALLLEGLSVEDRQQAFERNDREALDGFSYCDRFRRQAVELLEDWHSPTFIQTLVQTLKALWLLENSSTYTLSNRRCFDALAYALGQRDIFNMFDEIGFAPAYRRIAMVYFALGHFQVQAKRTFMRSVLASQELQQHIKQFLKETFVISEKEADRCIEAFYNEDSVRNFYSENKDAKAMEELFDCHFIKEFEGSEKRENFVSYHIDLSGVEEEEEEQKEEIIEQIEPTCLCVYREHSSAIYSLSWSPDGAQIVSGSADTTAQIWNWQTRKTIRTFRGHKESVNAVAWSPDGQWIASGGSDNKVFIWRARTGEIVTIYEKHTVWICSGLAWSPDGSLIASASWDGTVHIWEAMTGKTLLLYRGHSGVVTSVDWSPDGTQIVSGGGYPECAIHVWNASTGQLAYIYQAHMQDVEKTRPLLPRVLDGSEEWGRGASSIRSVAWSPDGNWIASVGLKNILRVWNAKTGVDQVAVAQDRTCGPLCWSADSTSLITANRDGVDIWDIALKRVTMNYAPVNRSAVIALAWSPDNQCLAAAGDHPRVCVWPASV